MTPEGSLIRSLQRVCFVPVLAAVACTTACATHCVRRMKPAIGLEVQPSTTREVFRNRSGGSADWTLELEDGCARLSMVSSPYYLAEFAGFTGELVGSMSGRIGEADFVSTRSARAKYRIRYERNNEAVTLYGLNRLWPGTPEELPLLRQSP